MKIKTKESLINYVDTNELFEFTIFENELKFCTFKTIRPLMINKVLLNIEITYEVKEYEDFVFSKEPLINLLKKDINTIRIYGVDCKDSKTLFESYDNDYENK
jgi:hypothetical protein